MMRKDIFQSFCYFGLLLIFLGFVLNLEKVMADEDKIKIGECCALKKGRPITINGVTCPPDANSDKYIVASDCTTTVDSPQATTCIQKYGGHCCPGSSQSWAMFCLFNTIYNITETIFIILMAIVGIFGVSGGFLIITSAGNPTKFQKGKNFIIFSLIGLALALLAKFFPYLIKFFLGV